MKKLLIGLLTLISISTYAREFNTSRVSIKLTYENIDGKKNLERATAKIRWSDDGKNCRFFLKKSILSTKNEINCSVYINWWSVPTIYLSHDQTGELLETLGLNTEKISFSKITLIEKADRYSGHTEKYQFHTEKHDESLHLIVKEK